MKLMITSALLLGAIGLTYGYAPKAEPEKAVFDVPKLVCADCVKKVESALSKASGVTRVESSYVSRRTLVEYDRRNINVQEVAGTLRDAGFESALVLAIERNADRQPLSELEKALLTVKGVEKVRIDAGKKQILVSFDKGRTATTTEILKSAEKAGFKVRVMQTLDDPKDKTKPKGGCCG